MFFLLTNDRPIKQNDIKPCARVLIPRCSHLGAIDGESAYFFVDV